MSTENLELELITLNDTIKDDLPSKINNNMQKIDAKYGELKDGILEQTGKQTLEEAIAYISAMSELLDIGNATSADMLLGKTALVQREIITGSIPSVQAQTITPTTTNQTINAGQYLSGTQTILGDANLVSGNIAEGKSIFGISGSAKKQPQINVTLDDSASTTYAGYISGYGAGIDHNGNLVIWAMSSSTSYEHINFVASSIIGSSGSGFGITSFDTSDPANVPHACTVTGLNGYSNLNVTLKPTSVNGTYDYIKVEVTITGS